MLFGIACLPLHHCILVQFFIFNYFVLFYLSCLPQSRGGEVTEIGKCWCAASDTVSDHNDNSENIGTSA